MLQNGFKRGMGKKEKKKKKKPGDCLHLRSKEEVIFIIQYIKMGIEMFSK